jgi:hypothetical protein
MGSYIGNKLTDLFHKHLEILRMSVYRPAMKELANFETEAMDAFIAASTTKGATKEDIRKAASIYRNDIKSILDVKMRLTKKRDELIFGLKRRQLI